MLFLRVFFIFSSKRKRLKQIDQNEPFFKSEEERHKHNFSRILSINLSTIKRILSSFFKHLIICVFLILKTFIPASFYMSFYPVARFIETLVYCSFLDFRKFPSPRRDRMLNPTRARGDLFSVPVFGRTFCAGESVPG